MNVENVVYAPMNPMSTGPRISAGRMARFGGQAEQQPQGERSGQVDDERAPWEGAGGAFGDRTVDEIARDRTGKSTDPDEEQRHEAPFGATS